MKNFVLPSRSFFKLGPNARRTARPGLVLILVVLISLVAGRSVTAQTFLFDFGADANATSTGEAPNDPANAWNNVINTIGISDTGQLSNIVTTLNLPSTMTLDMVRRFNGANGSGTQGSSIYPVNATRDSLFGNTEVFSGLGDVFPAFKLTGLSADTIYNLTFFASRTSVTDIRETGYTVTGGNTGFAALDAVANTNTTVSVEGIMPDAAGEILIEMAPTANNNNGNHFTYLGVLQVDALPPQGPLTFTEEPSNIQATELQSITFRAAVEGPAPYFVQWFSNSLAIPDAHAFSYTIPSVSLDMDRSVFSVTVSNLAFSVTSSNAVLRVVNDTEPPTLVSATSPDGLVIYLEFSELMEASTTDDFFLYVILDPAGVAVQTALLQADGRTVALTLSSQISGSFTVLVGGGASDLSANPIEPGSMISGKVPDIATQSILIDFGAAGTITEFGPAPDDPENYWNNLTDLLGTVAGSELTNLVTVLNAVTELNLVVVDRFNGANGNGTTAPAPYATEATRDSLYGNTEVWGGLTDIFPKFKLTGLNPDFSYDLTFYASRTGVGDVRETSYTVTGAVIAYATLDPANNIENQVVMTGVAPDAAGEILIGLTPTDNNNNSNHFTYLNVLRIDPKKPSARFLAPLVADGQILLQWTEPGQLQAAPEVTGPWTDVTPSSEDLHVEAIIPGGQRFYRLVPLP